MQARAHIPVPLPHPNPTASYWQDPPSRLASYRSTPHLPSRSEYVIIGSGISGASLAFHLLTRRLESSVLLLEARTAASGASGRNGGHTKPGSHRSFWQHRAEYGEEEAVRVARLEEATMHATHALVRERGIECDLNVCETVDVFFDEQEWRANVKVVRYMNEKVEGLERYKIWEKEDAQRMFRCPGAKGAITCKAGSVNSYSLTIGVLELAIEMGLNLQTNTAVTKVSQSENGGGWMVSTERGVVETSTVIMATNGYTAHLLPQFQQVIVPLRGQVSALRPGKAMVSPLVNTYTFSYGYGYDYMIPRPKGSKWEDDIVIGGGWATLPDGGACEFGLADDSTLSPEVSRHLEASGPKHFGTKNWGEDNEDGRVRKEWSGIMGTSADGFPYVGEMPDMPNLWICASFNGHGMSICYKAAEGLTSMILGEDGPELSAWFPQTYRLSKERLKPGQFEGRRNMRPPEDLID